MRCPSCLTPTSEPIEECTVCGLSLKKLDKKFGTVPRNLRYVTDLASLFEPKEVKGLQKQIEAFERRFGNCNLSIMTIRLVPRFHPREYFFWMFNRCHFSALDARLEHNFGLVLLIEMTSSTVMLTTGYGLEELIPETELQRTVDQVLPDFQKGEFYRGCKRGIEILDARLRELFKGAKKQKVSRLKIQAVPPVEQTSTPF